MSQATPSRGEQYELVARMVMTQLQDRPDAQAKEV